MRRSRNTSASDRSAGSRCAATHRQLRAAPPHFGQLYRTSVIAYRAPSSYRFEARQLQHARRSIALRKPYLLTLNECLPFISKPDASKSDAAAASRSPKGFARIRLLAAGICSTDLELQRGYYGFSRDAGP